MKPFMNIKQIEKKKKQFVQWTTFIRNYNYALAIILYNMKNIFPL